MTTSLLHDLDFHAWTQQQAGLLKSGNLTEIDVKHLIQEIESMGASERRELINRLAVIGASLKVALSTFFPWPEQATYY